MGWASGSTVARAVAEAAKKTNASKTARRTIYKALVAALDDQDWDTHDEALGIDPVFDAVLVEMNPWLAETDE